MSAKIQCRGTRRTPIGALKASALFSPRSEVRQVDKGWPAFCWSRLAWAGHDEIGPEIFCPGRSYIILDGQLHLLVRSSVARRAGGTDLHRSSSSVDEPGRKAEEHQGEGSANTAWPARKRYCDRDIDRADIPVAQAIEVRVELFPPARARGRAGMRRPIQSSARPCPRFSTLQRSPG
jgi:hypothetical protein